MSKITKFLSIILSGSMVFSLSACGTKAGTEDTSSNSKKGIELYQNLPTTDVLPEFEAVLDGFEKETGIQVNLVNMSGPEYESAMKTKMASNDLPDMWVTHGWSLLRYSEYLLDISDQPWVNKIDDGLRQVITNDKDELFILPVTQGVMALIYNKNVLSEAGIQPNEIHTWEDFNNACKKIKEIGKTPIAMGVNAGSSAPYLLESMFPTFLTNEGVKNAENNRSELKNGDFAWSKHTDVYELIEHWAKNSWFNEDVLSAKKDQLAQILANDEAAFTLTATDIIPSIKAQKADANISILPLPSLENDAPSYFGIGEGNASCFGIFKDSKKKDECKQLLEYFSRPEVASEIVKIDGGIPCLKDTKIDTSLDSAYVSKEYQDAVKLFDGNLYYDNFFDREYLPSGMWSVMGDSVSNLLSNINEDNVLDTTIAIVDDNYKDLSEK